MDISIFIALLTGVTALISSIFSIIINRKRMPYELKKIDSEASFNFSDTIQKLTETIQKLQEITKESTARIDQLEEEKDKSKIKNNVQQEEIKKLTKTLSIAHDEIHNLEKKVAEQAATIEHQHKEIAQLRSELDAMEKKNNLLWDYIKKIRTFFDTEELTDTSAMIISEALKELENLYNNKSDNEVNK